MRREQPLASLADGIVREAHPSVTVTT
jgi:hypothetical protein